MTHSLHRQGTYSDLGNDFVVLGFPGRKFDDVQATLNQFNDIGIRHQPVNTPEVKSQLSRHHLVYDSKEKVRDLLRDLVRADLGLSVTISGLRNQVTECCRAAGLRPHTVCQSLGFWGRTEQLPHFSILEITTMCGHGRVSPNLVWDLARQVQCQVLDTDEASKKMGKLCLCNIFNEIRASKLMRKLVAALEDGAISGREYGDKTEIVPKKDFGITIDEDKCIGCLDCIPYCPTSAIVKSSAEGTVSIDSELCLECGICWQSGVCPVEAILAKDLTWPRTLRGKFHNRHAPYRMAPLMAQVSQPKFTGEVLVFHRHQRPHEKTNDVDGLLRYGQAAVMVELGRPHVGTTFRDVQKVVQALVPVGLQLGQQYPLADERRPLTDLATDIRKCILRRDILDERTGWVFLMLSIPEEEVLKVLQSLQQVTAEISTVLAVDLVSRVSEDGFTIADKVASKIGIEPACNCKTNVGLGRPLADL